MKRVIFTLLAILVICSIAHAKYSGGSGTNANPYKIGTTADLLALAANESDYGKHFLLTADINLSSYTFSAAVIAPDTNNSSDGFYGVAFTGDFDGAGHKITNLTIISSAGKDYLGLFGYIDGGEIKNLGLENVRVIGGNGSSCLGGLAADNNGDIRNCYSIGTVTSGNTSTFLGGLAGYNSGSIDDCNSTAAVTCGINSSSLGGLVGESEGDIRNCLSTGNVTGGNTAYNTGALVGYNNGDISDCYSTGAARGGNNSRAVGGLVGWNDDGGNIITSYSTGTVTGGDTSYNIGGLVGYNLLSSVSNCYSTGNATGGDDSGALGGLVGWNNDGDITNCYSTGAVDGGFRLGGLVGYDLPGSVSSSYFLVTSGPDDSNAVPLTDAQMKQQSRFVGWDFVGETANGTDNIWTITEGVSYPKLVSPAEEEEIDQLDITKCSVTAGKKVNSDKISFSGTMNATADDFNDVNVVVTIDSNDINFILTFPINDKTWKVTKGKYSYSGTENEVKKSFKYNLKTGKFSFAASKLDLCGLACPLTVQIDINSYAGTTEIDEDVANGPKKPIPINLTDCP